jgi:hypothetical protein
VQREVHPAERNGPFLLLLPVNGQVADRRATVVPDEPGGVDEHPSRPAGGVVDLAVERLDHVDDQPDDGLRREELAATPPFVLGEFGQEVLVDEAERVAGHQPRERREEADKLDQDALLELLVSTWEHPAKTRVRRLDRVHREVDVGSEVFALGKVHEPRQAGDLGHEQHAPSAEVVGAHGPPLRSLQLELRSELVEPVLGEREEDEPEHGPAVLRGRQA